MSEQTPSLIAAEVTPEDFCEVILEDLRALQRAAPNPDHLLRMLRAPRDRHRAAMALESTCRSLEAWTGDGERVSERAALYVRLLRLLCVLEDIPYGAEVIAALIDDGQADSPEAAHHARRLFAFRGCDGAAELYAMTEQEGPDE